MTTPDNAPTNGEYVALDRGQFDLLRGALEGLLTLLVEDWEADVPVVKDPWSEEPPWSKESGYGHVWDAINQARGVLSASARWPSASAKGGEHDG